MQKPRKQILYFVFCILISWGCATSPKKETKITPVCPQVKPFKKEGVYHRVKRGETLWRISKLYGVELEQIVKANNLSDATKIYQGQLIFVPTSIQHNEIKEHSKKEFIWPIKGKVISFFGTKRADGTVNRGIDITPEENLNVVAIRKGKIIFSSERMKGLGKTIIIEHEDQIHSIYGNNSSVFVKLGQEVQQGELIAEAKKDILHFEIRKGHIPQNPLYFLP
ncbi:MAG: LysM peptidoglycan-binding domain-containing M23 family metallopeptidase [Candidatus Omnitrophica bacterium]|nr:LysM peptidoglycan-binding domain-containing M23 family metallopeptidase [Candidatus Omnitrophota bacterium]